MLLLRNLGRWQDLRGRNITFDRQVFLALIYRYLFGFNDFDVFEEIGNVLEKGLI